MALVTKRCSRAPCLHPDGTDTALGLLARHVRIPIRLQDRVNDAGEPVQLGTPEGGLAVSTAAGGMRGGGRLPSPRTAREWKVGGTYRSVGEQERGAASNDRFEHFRARHGEGAVEPKAGATATDLLGVELARVFRIKLTVPAELVQILGFPRTDAEGAEELSKAIGTATNS